MLIPKGTCVIYYTCDIWKSTASQIVRGIFTKSRALKAALKNDLEDDLISFSSGQYTLGSAPTIEALDKQLVYAFLEEATLNEVG